MQVLQLRNDLLHNLLFEPSTARLKKFRRKVLNGAFSPDEEMRCSDIEAREAIFTADLNQSQGGNYILQRWQR